MSSLSPSLRDVYFEVFFCQERVRLVRACGQHKIHNNKIIILCSVRTLSVSRGPGPATEVERSMSTVAISSSRPPPSINKRQSDPERRPSASSAMRTLETLPEEGLRSSQGMFGVSCLSSPPRPVWRGRESRNVALALSQQLGSFLVAVNHSGQSYVFSGRCRVQPQHTEVKPGSVKPGDRRETGERRQ